MKLALDDRGAPTLTVIAIGNTFATDDGVALAAIDALRTQWAGHPDLMLIALDGEPARLVEAWRGREAVWVLDAMTSGRPAGSVVEIGLDELPVGARRPVTSGGTHGTGVAEAIALGTTLAALPCQLRIFGIEGVDFAPGHRLGRSLTAVFEAVVNELDRMLRDALATTAARP